MRLAVAVHSLLENMLKKNKIDYLNATWRVKSIDNTLEKIVRKQYGDPVNQLTDISGIRVVTFLGEQVTEICELARGLFEVDEPNSLDRSTVLGHDRMGYRSNHLVCTLGKKRELLPEYESLAGLKFELQIRTVLQHAWAELAHDRSFKFGSTLPANIQRKLNLHSGLLEVVDTAFDEISKEIDEYKTSLDKKSIKQILKVEIDSLSLTRFLTEFSNKLNLKFRSTEIPHIAEEELLAFGVKNIGDLEKLTTAEFISVYKKYSSDERTWLGLLRICIMYNDLERALTSMPIAKTIWPSVLDILKTKYREDEIQKSLTKFGISVRNPQVIAAKEKISAPKKNTRPTKKTRKPK